jgi:hypothetical protein
MALSNQDRNANQKFTTEIVAPVAPSNTGGIRYSRQTLQQFAQCQAEYDQKRATLDFTYKFFSAAIKAALDAKLIEYTRLLTNCKLSVTNSEPYRWVDTDDPALFGGNPVSVTATECEAVYQNLVRAAHDEYRRQIDILDKEIKEGRNGGPGYDTILQEYIDCLSNIKYTPVTPEDVRRILS